MRFQFRIDYVQMPFMKEPSYRCKYIRARNKHEAAKKFMQRYDSAFCPVDIVSVDGDWNVTFR